MPHVRTQIRDFVATTVTGLPSTGANVDKSMLKFPANLPALRVMTLPEEADREVQSVSERRLLVGVEIFVKDTSDPQAAMDVIAVEVEEAMAAAGIDFGGIVKYAIFRGAEPRLYQETERAIATLMLSWDVYYRVLPTDVQTSKG